MSESEKGWIDTEAWLGTEKDYRTLGKLLLSAALLGGGATMLRFLWRRLFPEGAQATKMPYQVVAIEKNSSVTDVFSMLAKPTTATAFVGGAPLAFLLGVSLANRLNDYLQKRVDKAREKDLLGRVVEIQALSDPKNWGNKLESEKEKADELFEEAFGTEKYGHEKQALFGALKGISRGVQRYVAAPYVSTVAMPMSLGLTLAAIMAKRYYDKYDTNRRLRDAIERYLVHLRTKNPRLLVIPKRLPKPLKQMLLKDPEAILEMEESELRRMLANAQS